MKIESTRPQCAKTFMLRAAKPTGTQESHFAQLSTHPKACKQFSHGIPRRRHRRANHTPGNGSPKQKTTGPTRFQLAQEMVPSSPGSKPENMAELYLLRANVKPHNKRPSKNALADIWAGLSKWPKTGLPMWLPKPKPKHIDVDFLGPTNGGIGSNANQYVDRSCMKGIEGQQN